MVSTSLSLAYKMCSFAFLSLTGSSFSCSRYPLLVSIQVAFTKDPFVAMEDL